MKGSVDLNQILDYAKSMFITLPPIPSLTSATETTFKIITGVQYIKGNHYEQELSNEAFTTTEAFYKSYRDSSRQAEWPSQKAMLVVDLNILLIEIEHFVVEQISQSRVNRFFGRSGNATKIQSLRKKLQVVFDSLERIDSSADGVPMQNTPQNVTERQDVEPATPAGEEPTAIPRSLLHAHCPRPPVESAQNPNTASFYPLHCCRPHYAFCSSPPIIWCECHTSHPNPWGTPHPPPFNHPIRSSSSYIPYVTINTNVSDIGNNNSTTTTSAEV